MNEDNSGMGQAENIAETAAKKTQAAITKMPGRDWKGRVLFALGLGAPLIALLAAVGSGIGLWDFRLAFTVLMAAMLAALLVLLLGLLFGWFNKRKGQRGNRLLHWGGIALSLLFLGWMSGQILKGASVPAIHDVSTDLADPPQYRALILREDNWDEIPGEDDDEMRGLNPQQRWRKLHGDAYGDIRSIRVEKPVKAVMEKAERLAEDRGWDIAALRVAEGRLEATDTSTLFRFKDDVVLRVRPTEDGKGSIVDMRSVSRVGQSDLGVNAERIRNFLSDMSAE